MLTYALAVLAACANAVSSVLQRKANKRVPQSENMSLLVFHEQGQAGLVHPRRGALGRGDRRGRGRAGPLPAAGRRRSGEVGAQPGGTCGRSIRKIFFTSNERVASPSHKLTRKFPNNKP